MVKSNLRRVDKGRDRIIAQMRERLVAKVGFPYEKNPLHEDSHIKVAELAVVHEYGSEKRNIPARPFMRETGKRERKNVARLYAAMYPLFLRGELTLRQFLARLGVYYAAEMKETITEHGKGLFKPLRHSTIARKKGSTTPLLDTAGMKNAITSVVTKPEDVRK